MEEAEANKSEQAEHPQQKDIENQFTSREKIPVDAKSVTAKSSIATTPALERAAECASPSQDGVSAIEVD
jgi:hypothetical protein